MARILFYGFKYNLSLNEILDLTLEEFNIFLKAENSKYRDKEKDITKLAYYTAMFNNSKKLKSLDYYLKNIDNIYYQEEKENKNQKSGIEYAKKQFEKYEKLRKEGKNGKNIKSDLRN